MRNLDQRLFDSAASEAGVTIEQLEEFSEKTRQIRDRLHFHIDRRDLLEPEAVWRAANLTGDHLIELTDKTFDLLRIMHLALTNEERRAPDYHAEDVEPIIRSYIEAHRDAPIAI